MKGAMKTETDLRGTEGDGGSGGAYFNSFA